MPNKTKAEVDAFMRWWKANTARFPGFACARDEWQRLCDEASIQAFRAAWAAAAGKQQEAR